MPKINNKSSQYIPGSFLMECARCGGLFHREDMYLEKHTGFYKDAPCLDPFPEQWRPPVVRKRSFVKNPAPLQDFGFTSHPTVDEHGNDITPPSGL